MKKYISLFLITLFPLSLASAAQNFNVCLSLPTPLVRGQQSGDVLSLQQFLVAKGFLDVTPTGYFGQKTYIAVAEYQAKLGLEQVGQVGPLTSAAIRQETCSGASFGGATVAPQTASVIPSLTSIPETPVGGDAISVLFYSSAGAIQTDNVVAYCGDPSSIDMLPTNKAVMSGDSFLLSRSKCVARGGKLWVPSSVNCGVGEIADTKRDAPFTIESGKDIYEFRCVKAPASLGTILSDPLNPVSTTTIQVPISPSSYTGPVYGAGVYGIPGNQPVTYSWVVYAGSSLGQQSATNLGFQEPTTPCTSANAGVSYYLGTSSSGQQVVATCNPSDQAVTNFGTVNETTVNAPSSQQASSSTYVRGTFTSEKGETVEWACGAATDPAPSDASGWVPQTSGCYHRVVQ
ncbi:MAG: hypothetical protein RIQ41_363 [Candidatus Parcubacteria bacterium]|jgi:peptidoglycan hydrolase-like protein with peptidoglycan-binding domain